MNRLQAELQRLYLQDRQPPDRTADKPIPTAATPRVRAMVLELGRPASWDALSRVWRGVQSDLELPAPAIAVSGTDSYQLWFSFAQPLPLAQSGAFLDSLRKRYLADIAPARIRFKAPADPSRVGEALAAVLPPVEAAPGCWSAFLAPDLAGLFEDEPWLDLPPGRDQQADLLCRLATIRQDDLQRALERLADAEPAPTSSPGASTAAAALDPRAFLVAVMNDSGIDLRLRIDAATALLPYTEAGARQ